MNDISAYINSAILKIPFNLFNIISRYIELNSRVKITFLKKKLKWDKTC